MPRIIIIKTILLVFLAAILPIIIAFASISIACLLILLELYAAYVLVPQWDSFLFRLKRKLKNKKIAVLTFDDGPDEPWTSKVLDILVKANVKATFFVQGQKALKHPETIRRIKAEGHDIGNHTTNHQILIFKNKKALKRDIENTSDVICRITGQKPTLFRSPHGFKTFSVKKILKGLNLKLVSWTKGIWDTDGADKEELMRRFSKNFADLEILLLHDGIDESLKYKDRTAMISALEGIIMKYKERGYSFMKVSEIMNSRV